MDPNFETKKFADEKRADDKVCFECENIKDPDDDSLKGIFNR